MRARFIVERSGARGWRVRDRQIGAIITGSIAHSRERAEEIAAAQEAQRDEAWRVQHEQERRARQRQRRDDLGGPQELADADGAGSF